jgi:LuxR family transcriptional regulator, regulator of acetate metabolism
MSERLDALLRVRAALRRLEAIGPVSELIEHGAVDAAEAAALDRVLLSRVRDGAMIAEALHVAAGEPDAAAIVAELRAAPPRLTYPLIECELLRRRHARLITDLDGEHPSRYAFLDGMGWERYVAAPIVVNGQVIGLLHGDRDPGRQPLTDVDVEALEDFAAGFALLLERAVLRRRLRDQHREIKRIAGWAEVRAGELSDGEIELAIDRAADAEPREPSAAANGLVAHLTARERDVLELMATGKTNGEIARALVVTEGTVKFHVKNVLRKLQASNRADATSRYLRLTLQR